VKFSLHRHVARLSLKRKLRAIAMTTVTAALLLAGGLQLTRDIIAKHDSARSEIDLAANILAQNSTAAFSFNDAAAAEDLLRSLIAKPDVVAAALYTRGGAILARYVRSGQDVEFAFPRPAGDGTAFEGGRLITFRTVVLDEQPIGQVWLESDLRTMNRQIAQSVLIDALVLVAAGALAFLLTVRLQKLISAPILHLAQTAKAVTFLRNYAIRAKRDSDDELGLLIEDFNAMLDEIERRDRELQRHRESLEEQVADRTAELRAANRSLEEARDRAEEASRAKGQFLANMSHEIRTPMNGIIGMAELALELTTDPELRNDLLTIRSSGESLLAVVNQILDFSKMEAGRMELEFLPFHPREVVAEVARLLESGGRKKGLRIAWEVASEVPATVLGDALRLRQVLLNLGGNAVKFTDRGSVSIAVSARPPDQSVAPGEPLDILDFSVRDTGIGIPADKLKAIFDPFSQADSSMSRRFGGTGLGLTISARLVRMMGGEIGVESTLGAGSCFSFRVRMGHVTAPPVESRSEPAVPLSSTGPGLHVLLAEDHPVNRQLVVKMLEKHGHTVTTAENGLRAAELFGLQTFDIVLMDIQMPVMNGFEATAAIRKAEGGRSRVPIVALTAHSADRDRSRCLAADMDDYLSKPIRPRDLLAALDRNMARAKSLASQSAIE